MQSSVVRRTQELLGRVIRKPPLTERLLSKPPFRYLHDVIGEVIRSTGFMKGLYTEAEMKSDNVKDKDAKIIFLQKAIDVVIMVTGEYLAVKPARVVAGHEPERTNEFLQAIAKCCLNKLSSDEAVQKVLAEEKAIKEKALYSSKSQNRESKTEECRYHKEGRGDSEIKDKSTVQNQKIKEELKEEESKQRENEKYKDYENHPNNFDKTVNESEKYEKERIKNRLSKSGREPEKIRNKEKEEGGGEKEECDKERDKERKQYEGGREKDRLREKDKPRDRDKDYEKVRDRGKEKDKRRERGKDIETTREERKDKTDKKPTGSEENVAKKLAEKSIKDQAEFDKENENSARLSKQQATKGPRQRNKTSSEGESFGDAEGDVLNTGTTEKISENNEFTNEIPSQITQRKPRPSSARPAPPRIKRQQSTEILIPERNGSAKIVSNVIIDKEEEEDDQFIVKAEQQLPEITELKMETTVDLEEDEKHGSLVQRILETKKDYELSQLQKSAEKEKPLLSEAAKRKEKDLVTKEIEKFCSSIQALCRSALPLGKIMDYIQEDVDAMKNELQTWQNENKELEETLWKEQGITDGVVEPLKIDLTELDQLIKDEEDKIYTKRANVLRNNEKIQKLVHIINSRR
ncbi:TRAF3-interacting protein 1 [Protobothrops mucrosquamatus]|uniref:TRAF3-interacting protein 1 n=1 Tax=Protobothrops mucrosquamatus TaxID=103944 RepID=UPI000775A9D9|nr:TRAF3-interacting protein 1 [Protobothrops mucrosquamatus]